MTNSPSLAIQQPVAHGAARPAWYETLLDRGLIPDALLRAGIRRRLWARIRDEERGGIDAHWARVRSLLADLSAAPVAISTREANQQHYELPPEFTSVT